MCWSSHWGCLHLHQICTGKAVRNFKSASKKSKEVETTTVLSAFATQTLTEHKWHEKSNADSFILKPSPSRPVPPVIHMIPIQAIMCQTFLWPWCTSLQRGEVLQSHADTIKCHYVFYSVSFYKARVAWLEQRCGGFSADKALKLSLNYLNTVLPCRWWCSTDNYLPFV